VGSWSFGKSKPSQIAAAVSPALAGAAAVNTVQDLKSAGEQGETALFTGIRASLEESADR